MGKNNRHSILIVDDSDMNRMILSDILSNDYDVLEATNGQEALDILDKNNDIDLVLLDVVMPVMDGYTTLTLMRERGFLEDIPVIIISAEQSQEYIEKAYNLQATDYITRPFYPSIVLKKISNTLLLYTKQKKLINLVEEQIYQRQKTNNLMVLILSHIVEFRNGESGLHILHIRTITEILLNHLIKKSDKYHLSSSQISLIVTASTLHDIGKIAIDESILNKPGRLTFDEFQIMKTHTTVGAEMLDKFPFFEEEELLKVSYEVCRWHHERFDGRGYPDGLKGDDIPISAQIVSIADVYDALTSERCYKKAFSHEKAIEMIFNNECGVFNPILLECLKEAQNEIRESLTATATNYIPRNEVKDVVNEVLSHNDVISNKTLQILQYEKEKFEFFASLTNDVLFEITFQPETIVFSTDPSDYDLEYKVVNPSLDGRIIKLLGPKNIRKIKATVSSATINNSLSTFEMVISHNNKPRYIRMFLKVLFDNENPTKISSVLGKLVNITAEKSKINELSFIASHDSLTNLLNKSSAMDVVNEMLVKKEKTDYVLAIFDLDMFKSANDTYGHTFGDKVLKNTAKRLSKITKQSDIIARIGGDEFMLFFAANDENYKEIISNVHKNLAFSVDGFKIEASMGVAYSKVCGRKLDSMFDCADKALYYSKANGKNQYNFYDDSMKDVLYNAKIKKHND